MRAGCEWVDSLDGFRALREPWNELVAQTDVDHAFMTHAWFECWIQNLGDPGELAIGTLWADGLLTGIAPMGRRRIRVKGVPARALSFLSSGVSPSCNFILSETSDSRRLFAFLTSSKDWDLVLTRNSALETRATTRYLAFVDEQLPGRHIVRKGRSSPYLHTQGSWDEYWKSRSRNLKEQLRKGRSRLKKVETLALQQITAVSEFESVFDELLQTSSRSWKAGGGTDLGSRPELQGFYRDFTRASDGMNRFEAWFLRIDGAIAAFDYYLKSRGRLCLIRNDFDPAYGRYSPGNVLRASILEDLFGREGVWEYDMGGHAYDYKLRWADKVRDHMDVIAAAQGLYGHLLVKVWRGVRNMQKRLRPAPTA